MTRGFPAFWTRVTWLTLLLVPLSLLFRVTVALRRQLYLWGLLRSERLPVPVVVVGNISVGGTGKTPLVLWLASRLRSTGLRPGIISRGYGGSAAQPRAVHGSDDPALCGDEPVLLARLAACPVWIGAARVAAARALLAAHPDCNVILSDDGLQHYGLVRDAEISVIDGTRGLGNGYMLPAGPLREPAARLETVDAVVIRGTTVTSTAATPPHFSLTLEPAGLRNLQDANRSLAIDQLQGQRVHAVAGIGNPQQFFDTLTRLGIAHTPHPFADHHAYTVADLAFAGCDAVVMTEKDAVKCERFANATHWALQTEARVDEALMPLVLDRIKRNR